jgi:hypothetical protein
MFWIVYEVVHALSVCLLIRRALHVHACLTSLPIYGTRSICASCRAVLLFDCLVTLGHLLFGLTMLHWVFDWFILGYLNIIWNLPVTIHTEP